MWKVKINYIDGTKKEVKASGKFDAKSKYDTYRHKDGVDFVAVFEDEDYIDPTEL